MRPQIIPALLLIFLAIIMLVSGCTGGFDPTTIAKANSMVKQFMNEHPNAKITISHYSGEQAGNIIQQIRQDCDNQYINPKEFYRVKVTDNQTGFYAIAWVDAKNRTVECAYKTGASGKVIDNHQPTCESHNYSKCDSGNLYWFDSCGKRQEVRQNCDNGCSNNKCQESTCTTHAEARCDGNSNYWFDSCGNKEELKEYCYSGCSNGACIIPNQNCTNECDQAGIKQCVESNQYKTCGNYDSDSCLEWSAPSACAQGQVCTYGECGCIPQTCTQIKKQCGSWADGCGGNINCGSCDSGYSCNSSGQCTCANECSPYLSRQCASSDSYRICEMHGDLCLTWSQPIDCPACLNGNCGPTGPQNMEHCKELVPGHNDLSGNRINLIFIAGGTPSLKPTDNLDFKDLFKAMVEGIPSQTDPIYRDAEGLKGIEPYASNYDKFNFWYIDVPLFGENNPGYSDTFNIYANSELRNYCNLRNKFVHISYKPTSYVQAQSSGGGGISQAYLGFGCDSGDYAECFTVFLHEFSHSFAGLHDERMGTATLLSAESRNCFSLGEQQITSQECAKSDKLPWQDLIGNGCGKDGIVDCEIKPSYNKFDEWIYEVRDDIDGCGQGCEDASNVFRPFMFRNIMSDSYLTNQYNLTEVNGSYVHKLGVVNEREACRKVKSLTNYVSSYCQKLCLDGCAFGERCVQGVCTPKNLIT